MPITSGDIGVASLLSVALLGFASWIRSIANKCSASELRLDKRIKIVEGTVVTKSSLIDIHGVNLSAGEKKMDEMKLQLETMNVNMNSIRLLLKDVSGDIKGLSTKITAGTEKVFMKLDPRITRIEEKVDDLENDKEKK